MAIKLQELGHGGDCDGCGKYRRTLYVAAVNEWDGVVEAAICFFCVKEYERHEQKMMEEMFEEDMRQVLIEYEEFSHHDYC